MHNLLTDPGHGEDGTGCVGVCSGTDENRKERMPEKS